MKEFIDKLIARLEEKAFEVQLKQGIKHPSTHDMFLEKFSVREIEEIVNQLAEEYNNGWIPCISVVPQDGDWVLCYGTNREGRIKYEVSTYAHEIQCWMCSRIEDVIAWQPITPYQPKG